MAMNKKEIAELDRLKTELRIARAFRFTDGVKPDVMPPTSFSELRKGFLFNAYLNEHSFGHVDVACTCSIYHAFGRNDKTTTQQSRSLYSTRLLALKAMRHEMELKCARLLSVIDYSIEKEQAIP